MGSRNLIPVPTEGDWRATRRAFQKLNLVLGIDSSPTFDGGNITTDLIVGNDLSVGGSLSLTGTLTLSGLSASRLVATNASKELVSSDLSGWITGTTNQVTVTDDGDGTVTLAAPQNIHANADVTFDSLILNDLTTLRLVATDGSKKLISSNLVNWVTDSGHGNTVVTDDTNGGITLNTAQDLLTSDSPTFAGLTLAGATNLVITFDSTSVDSTITWQGGQARFTFANNINIDSTNYILFNGGSGGSIRYDGTDLEIKAGADVKVDDDLIVTGTALINGTLTLATGSITDSTGTISFGNEDLTTTGDITCDQLGLFGESVSSRDGIYGNFTPTPTNSGTALMRGFHVSTFLGTSSTKSYIYGIQFGSSWEPDGAFTGIGTWKTVSLGAGGYCIVSATVNASANKNMRFTVGAGMYSRFDLTSDTGSGKHVETVTSAHFWAEDPTANIDTGSILGSTLHAAFYDEGQYIDGTKTPHAYGIYTTTPNNIIGAVAGGKLRIGSTSAPTVALDVVGDVTATGDLYWTSDGSGIPYGDMYISSTITVTISDNNPTEVLDATSDGWTANSPLNLTTFPTGGDEHYISVDTAGVYEVVWNMSFSQNSPSASIVAESGIMVNGSAQTMGKTQRTISNSTDVGSVAGVAHFDLAANDQISLFLTNTTNTTNLDVEYASVSVKMIGGT